ncbi:MAG: Rne/Rng family ribonuclease, partial [Deltaproteobacteria bacterium]|nr:Rne/Rng family ribonuclease [Deltaproteobacteria bacterium]
LPHYSHVLKLYSGKASIFDHYGITHELDRAMSRKVWLKSGGHLVIDQSEALTAIDVNTGRFTGSDSHEKTILITNMESAVEIVHQLKLRDIGGIIIIDFIDMEAAENREKVFRTLKNELKKDKAKTKVLPISEIGLVEMTRKRNRENLGRFLRTHCPYCDGTARILSPASIIYEIYREILRLANGTRPPRNLLLGLHSDIAEYLEIEEVETYRSMERLIKGTISLQTSDKFHYEQFELLEL